MLKFKTYFITLLSFLFLLPSYSVASLREMIIDTDVGMDDVIAILYILQNPQIKVKAKAKAITIEGDGSAHCAPAYANAQKLLELVGQTHVPMACGRATPLKGSHSFPKKVLHDCDTLLGTAEANPTVKIPNESAKNLMIKTLS